MNNNPFKVLGVSSFDSKDTIKIKYRNLCKIYHPDNNETGDANKFQEIQKAWKLIENMNLNQVRSRGLWGHKTLFTLQRR